MEGDSTVEKKVKKHVTQIACILCAVGLWMYVTYTEDPEMQVWMRNIPVSYQGAEALSANGITFTKKDEPEEIHVKVSGRRSFLRRLRESDIQASVNYASITDAGEHTLPIDVTLSQRDLRVTKLSQSTVSCATDISVTMEKIIFVTTSGAEPLGLHDFTASPPVVRVTGAKSTLEKINASVFIDLKGGEASSTQAVSLTGQGGEAYTGGDIKIEPQTVEISAIRDLPIEIEAANEPADGEIRKIVCEPETASAWGDLASLLKAEKVRGAYKVWVDYSYEPAQSGNVPLIYPKDVTPLGATSANASFYKEEAAE